MRDLVAILSGVGLLIAIYLFLSRGNDTVKIINAMATNSVKGISTLQGR